MCILVAVQPVDFLKNIDGLAAVCRGIMDSDHFSDQDPGLRRAGILVMPAESPDLWVEPVPGTFLLVAAASR